MAKEKRTYSDRRQYLIEAVRKRRKEIRKRAVAYKGYRCERCGYDDCMEALEFHHNDPSKKDFGISSKGYTRSWMRVQKELDKCVMLCANCHREVHMKLAALSRNTEMKSGLIQGNPAPVRSSTVSQGNPELALSLDEILERECRDFTPATLTCLPAKGKLGQDRQGPAEAVLAHGAQG